jgi:hypothetical protein
LLAEVAVDNFWVRPLRPLGFLYFFYPFDEKALVGTDELQLSIMYYLLC